MFKLYTVIIACCLASTNLFSQTHTPIYLSQSIPNANSKGFYRYLPADYNSSTKNYPLIIWFHGAGQLGQGNAIDLPKVLQLGLPNVISNGGFPATFTVADTVHSFIVISPQFVAWPSATNVAGMITYVTANYRINPDRIYLLGMSAGGGGVWDYASASVANSNKLAAIIPFAGTTNPTQAQASIIASTSLPVWAFHNTNDGTIPVTNSRNWRNMINGYIPTPNPLMRLTEFPVVSSDAIIAHDCWTNTTVPTYKVNNQNIYEWLLGYRKRVNTANIPPAAYAGDDAAVFLPASLSLNGLQSSDPDGSIVSYRWRKVSGPASHLFSDSTLANPTVQNLSVGVYSFELTVTDNQNASSKDTMLANVSPEILQGNQRQVLIDVGPTATAGAVTPSPTNGYFWNNMTDARPGVRVANAKTITNANTTIGLSVINRIDGTVNTAGNGMNGGNTTPAVGIYPTTATRDFAYAHSSATNGQWKISGLDPNQLYVIKFWGTKSGETINRDLEIKRSDEPVWKSYSAAGNVNFTNAAFFNVLGKTEIDFDIRTKTPSIYGYINVVDITWNTQGSNLPPVANAGADFTSQVPPDSATLNGCASSDPEGAMLKFKWTKISGPTGAYFTNDSICNARVKGLVFGNYSFELQVTDIAGLSHKDTVGLTTTQAFSYAWPVLPAPICQQPFKLVILGSSTAAGTGAMPLDSSWALKLKKYLLQQNAQTTVVNLALGGYTSYHINPTGFVPEAANKPFPDTAKNITAALALNPQAIIMNLPSNDAASAFTLLETQNNFNRIVAAADSQNVPVWVTTAQPRSGLSAGATQNLVLLKDWVNQRFGSKAIDFWTDIANADGTVNNYYSAGDGVHVNNYGHHTLFARILNERIWDSVCLRRLGAVNRLPVANAGLDLVVQWPVDSVRLNGAESYDQDGIIMGYKWQKIQGGNATLLDNTNPKPLVKGLFTGNYLFELEVTDGSLSTDKDTVLVIVNQQPNARAGADVIITLPVNSTTISGFASFDADGTIVNYLWRKVSGPAGGTLSAPTSAQTTVNFSIAGSYQYELTVTDNNGGTHKDSLTILVNPDSNVPPVAKAGPDWVIELPVSTIFLDGRASTDANGTITLYQWSLLSGPAGSLLSTPAKDTCTVSFVNPGNYIFRLKVTDNAGLSATDDVQINVIAGVTNTKSIKVNVVNAGIIFNNAQWNNWNPVANVNSAIFKYEDGTASTVFVNLLQGGNFSDNGANYMPSATGCPPEVLRINSMHTIQRTLTVSGLNPSKTYNFEFYGSRGFTSSSRSIFRTGTKADTITTDFNANDVARLNDITPDNTGRIIFTLSIAGSYHYMAGFTIIEPIGAPTAAPFLFTEAPQKENNQSINDQNRRATETSIFPNPFTDKIQIARGYSTSGSYKIYLTDVTGQIILQKNIANNNQGAVENLTVPALQKGIYFLRIVSNQKQTVHKLIKQ